MPLSFGRRPYSKRSSSKRRAKQTKRPQRRKKHRNWDREKMLKRVAKTRKFPVVYAVRIDALVKVDTHFCIRGILRALQSDRAEGGPQYRLIGYHWAASIPDAEQKARAIRERLAPFSAKAKRYDAPDEAVVAAVHLSSIGKRWLDTIPPLSVL